MESLDFSHFLRILVFPRMTANFEYEAPEKDLFSKISAAKQNHSRLISRALIDGVNKKFWVEAGGYRNVTTFKGVSIEEGNVKFIKGSFTNSGTFVSYPFLIFCTIAWILLLISRQSEMEIPLYFVFSAILHLSVSFSFKNHIENIIKFLEIDLGVHASQGEIAPRKA